MALFPKLKKLILNNTPNYIKNARDKMKNLRFFLGIEENI